MTRRALLLAISLVCGPAMLPAPQREARQTGSRIVERPGSPPVIVRGVRYNSGGHKDPFLNPILLRKKTEDQEQEVPPGEPLPGIAGTYIAQSKLLGVVRRNGDRIAVFQASDMRAYFMKESDRLFDGYILKIDTESVTLVRETRFRSGRVITQEVVKRLRTQ